MITAVSATPGSNGRRTSTYTKEEAVWTGVRDTEHPYGCASFTVAPGRHQLSVFQTFTLHRRRSDGPGR